MFKESITGKHRTSSQKNDNLAVKRGLSLYFAAMYKVLVDLHRVGKNRFNGLYTYCYQLGKSLLRFPAPGIELFYYIPKEQFGLFGDKVNYVPQRSIDKFYRFNTSKYDLWHATTTLSWYRPFNKKTKFIFNIHDLNFVLEQPDKIEKNKRILSQIQGRVDRADHLIAISRFAKEQAEKYLDLRGKPVSVIYPGCALLTNPVEATPPTYIPTKPFLFSIGLLIPRKNFHVLMPLLKGNDYELIIAGLDESDYKQTIIGEAKKHGVEDCVKLVGPIAEGEKIWYFQHCEAFMFPSFAEGFGLPVVEALYYGKPVFLSKEASLPEVGGDAAYYFDSFEPDIMRKNFIEGMNDYQQRKPIDKIKQRAALFNYDNAAKEMLDIYQKILKDGK